MGEIEIKVNKGIIIKTKIATNNYLQKVNKRENSQISHIRAVLM